MDDGARIRRQGERAPAPRGLRDRLRRAALPGEETAVEAAQHAAHRFLVEARRQVALLEAEGRAEAEDLKRAATRERSATIAGIERSAGEIEAISARLNAQSWRVSDECARVHSANSAFAEMLDAIGPTAERARHPLLIGGREIPWRAIAATAAYWALVLAVSIALVVALILMLESRDSSSLGT